LAIDAADDSPPTHVLGDAVLLRRALENLLENAHTYTVEAAAPLTVRLRQDGDDAIVAIIDRGICISEVDLRDVFRPFFRADRSRARRTGGLGLGLALTKRIVEAHRGTVTIASELGRGTTATIRLPMVDSE
jgi:signal transduction histidine kinase